MIPWILLVLFQWWWAIPISIVSIWSLRVIFQRLGGSQPSRVQIEPKIRWKPSWKTSGKLALGVLLLPIALWLLAGVITYMAWATPRAASAVAESINGPQGHTQVGSVEVRPASPLKSLGGPLQWSDNAKAKLRNRVRRETVGSNGAAFVGVIPPTSWMDTTFVAYSEESTAWKAFLMDYTSMGNFPSSRLLNNRAASGENVRNVAMVHLPKLSHGREEKRIENTLPQSATRVTECYIQLDGGPTAIHLDIREPSDTFQYEVEVGANETSFVIPQSFKWLWIAPVHHEDYQLHVNTIAIPSKGRGDEGTFAIMLQANDETRPLDQAQLFQSAELLNRELKLSVKDLKVSEFVSEDDLREARPARIIVGIQM